MELFSEIAEYTKNVGIDAELSSSTGVICALSGGADSTVLLLFLKSYLKNLGVPLYAVHVNHGIRGLEADRDEAFCRKLCEKEGIPFTSEKFDVPKLAAECSKGLEETARNVRYSSLRKAAKALGACHIATAHNATDNLETVIFNLARGTGIAGLSGISPISGDLIRPLLSVTSEEIREWAKQNGISYVTDSTNLDTDYTRNHIRKNIVPEIRKINPKADAAALRLSRSASEDNAYLYGEAEIIVGDNTEIARDKLSSLPPSLLSRVVMILYKNAVGSMSDISEKNVSDCCKMIGEGCIGSISLPKKATLFIHKDAVFVKIGTEDTESTPDCEITLSESSPTEFGDYLVILGDMSKTDDKTRENIYNLFIKEYLDYDKIKGTIKIRKRASGDTYKVGGVNRKLKKYMCDKNVPQRLRDTLPLICDDDGIILVPTLRVSDRCRVSGTTERKLCVTVYRKDN